MERLWKGQDSEGIVGDLKIDDVTGVYRHLIAITHMYFGGPDERVLYYSTLRVVELNLDGFDYTRGGIFVRVVNLHRTSSVGGFSVLEAHTLPVAWEVRLCSFPPTSGTP